MRHIFSLFILFAVLVSCETEDMATPGLLVPKTVVEDTSLPSLQINGTQLHVESFGNPVNPIIIVIHGGPGADYRSMYNAKELAQQGYFVVFYDQRGSGLSKREDKETFETGDVIALFLSDLDELIEHFRTNQNQSVFLLGHSWGAMLATGYVNAHPEKINGVILAEPGGFTWTQTNEYLSRSNHIELFSEALNNAVFTDQVFVGRNEHEILDYKASYFTSFENAPGNAIGNAGIYPFWRSGAVVFSSLIAYADIHNFDLKSNLKAYPNKILFLYSELNTAYGLAWAETLASEYSNAEIDLVKGSGHEMIYFGWADMYPKVLNYLNQMK